MTANELAQRRKRILKLGAAGKTAGEIAEALGITPRRALHSLRRARMHASGAERFGVALPRIQNILRRAGFNNRAEVAGCGERAHGHALCAWDGNGSACFHPEGVQQVIAAQR
jgi:hypothetical protein